MNRRQFIKGSLAFGVAGYVQPLFAADRPFHITFYQDWAPFSSGPGEDVKGLLIDILDEALHHRLGVTVKYSGLPWKRAQTMVQRGIADAFCTTPNDERRSYTVVSQVPAVISPKKIYVSSDHPDLKTLEKVTSLEELQNYTFSGVLGGGWEQANLESRGFDILYKPSLDECLKLVALKRRDIFIGDKFTISLAVKKHGFTGKIIELPATLDKAPYNLCISQKSSYRSSINDFDRVMLEMKADGTQQKILDRYL